MRLDLGMETKKGMDGLAFYVQRRNSGGSEDDVLLFRFLPEVLKERRLSRTRAASEKDIVTRRLDCIKSVLELFRDFDFLKRRILNSRRDFGHCSEFRIRHSLLRPFLLFRFSFDHRVGSIKEIQTDPSYHKEDGAFVA